jgi:hypothetical protein
VNHPILARTLWYERKDEILEVDQSFLTAELSSLVVLGEAGMGKTTLLGTLRCKRGFAVCTARQLINRDDPKTLLGSETTLVVDALDEVSARREGDAVDLVVRKLGQLGYARQVSKHLDRRRRRKILVLSTVFCAFFGPVAFLAALVEMIKNRAWPYGWRLW